MSRRRPLIATAIAVILGGTIAPQRAQALFGAGDVVFDPSVFAQVVQQAKNGLQQLQQLEQNGQILTNQLTQLRSFYQSFAQLTDVSQLASILQTPAVINPLPQVTQLEGMLSGNGFTGQLGSLVQQFVNQNRVYAPTGTDWQAQEMLRTANVTASQMALGNQLYSSAAQRIQGLTELEARLSHGVRSEGDARSHCAIEHRERAGTGASVAGSVACHHAASRAAGRAATRERSRAPRCRPTCRNGAISRRQRRFRTGEPDQWTIASLPLSPLVSCRC